MIIKRDLIYTPKGENRLLHIYLPDNYCDTSERLPVMYFFDGHNLFRDEDATFGKSWGMRTFLEQWTKTMIVVGIECGHEGQERLVEYKPYPARFFDTSAEECLGEETFQWIIHEIKPLIDREYRTQPFRECTAIGGSSMGGLMALYGVVHHNRWFSKAACVSSAVGFCMEHILKDLETSVIDADTRVYLSWGTKEAKNNHDITTEDTHSDTYHWNQMIADQIAGYDARVKIRCQIGGGHCEADWEKLVPEFMNFLWLED